MDGELTTQHPANVAYSKARLRFFAWAKEEHHDVWFAILEEERRAAGINAKP
jgi:hypothetical protein